MTEEVIVAVTGHRPHKLGSEYNYIGPYTEFVREQLRNYLLTLKPIQAISGVAQGVDTIFALLSLELKIPLLAAVPFKGQEAKWPKKAQELYFQILNDPLTSVVYVSEPGYDSAKLQIRNEYMVDHCNLLLAVYDGTKGGTYNCIQYARRQKRDIRIIDPNGWRKPVQAPIVNTLF